MSQTSLCGCWGLSFTLCPGVEVLGLGDPGFRGPRRECSPCLWNSGSRLALQGCSGVECGVRNVSFCRNASLGVSSAFALYSLGMGSHLFQAVWLWPAPGLGSRRVRALGLAGGLLSSHRSAGHGVTGFPARGSSPACSHGHLCWRRSRGFVLLSCWPETLSHFHCGPATPRSSFPWLQGPVLLRLGAPHPPVFPISL